MFYFIKKALAKENKLKTGIFNTKNSNLKKKIIFFKLKYNSVKTLFFLMHVLNIQAMYIPEKNIHLL